MSGSGAARDSLQAVGPPKPETELQRLRSFANASPTLADFYKRSLSLTDTTW